MTLDELKDAIKVLNDKAQYGGVGDCYIESRPEDVLAVVNCAIDAERDQCAKRVDEEKGRLIELGLLLEKSEKGREADREKFRQGVDAWQKRIRKAVKRIWDLRAKSASDKDCIAFVESDAVYARGEWRKAEGTIRKAEEQVILLLEQVGSLRGKLADAEKRARDNGDQAAAHLEDLEGLRRKAQLHKEAKWDAEKRLASVEKGAARMKAVVDAAIKWREARRALPDAQLRGDESEDVAFHAYDDAIQKLQRAVSELE